MRTAPSVGGVWWVVTCTEVMRMRPRSHKTCLSLSTSCLNSESLSWLLNFPPFPPNFVISVTWLAMIGVGPDVGGFPHHPPPLPSHSLASCTGNEGQGFQPNTPAKHLHMQLSAVPTIPGVCVHNLQGKVSSLLLYLNI